MASNLYAGDESLKTIKYSGFSSTILSSFSSSSVPAGSVVWDGTNVIYAGGSSTNSIFKKGSGFSSTVIDSFIKGSTAGYTYDMHLDGTNIIFADGSTKIRKTTGFSSTIGSSITTALVGCRGVTWDGTNLFASDGNTAKRINKYSGFSTTVSSSLTSASLFSYKGITWDGSNIYYVNNTTTPRVIQGTGFSLTVTASFAVGAHTIDGIDWGTDAVGGATVSPRKALLGVGL